jgi:hypothetical protein
MKTIIALGSLALVATTIACAAASPDGTGEAEQRQTEGEGEGTGESGGKPGATATTASPDGGTPSTGKTGKGAPADEPPADPACVTSCNDRLKAKCQEDDTFCSWVCSAYSTEFVNCLAAAQTCEKPEWIRCAPQEPATDTGTSGKK